MRIFVNAKQETAWELARHYDMSSVPWIRFLFNLRTIADLFHPDKSAPHDKRIGLDQIGENDNGFMIIHEIPGKEVVVGAIGKFWHVDIPFEKIAPDKFRNFDEPGWGKLAWSITVEPYSTGSTVAFELRTTATDYDRLEKAEYLLSYYWNFFKINSSYPYESFGKRIGRARFPR